MRRIRDLKDKVDFVESVSEFRALRARIVAEARSRLSQADIQARLRSALQEKKYASEIGVQDAQWSRIKKGENPIKDHQLSALASFLDLDDFGGAELWMLPLEEFKDVLKRKGYGKLAAAGGIADLPAQLRALAGSEPVIRVLLLDDATTRGIGDSDDPGSMPVLAVGGRVRIEILASSFDGWLLVLSEDPSGRLVALGGNSSVLLPAVAGATMLLPARDGAYPVGKPFGRHSLYAAQFPAKPRLPAALTVNGEPVGALSLAGSSAISGVLADVGDAVRVGLLDYRVE